MLVGCANCEDPRWGGFCDGCGVSTEGERGRLLGQASKNAATVLRADSSAQAESEAREEVGRGEREPAARQLAGRRPGCAELEGRRPATPPAKTRTASRSTAPWSAPRLRTAPRSRGCPMAQRLVKMVTPPRMACRPGLNRRREAGT